MTLSIDGLDLNIVRPATVAEVCEIVRTQRAKQEAVYPVGGRTMLDFGLPPVKPGVALDMTGLNQVIDYPARDMTITVQAGITMAKLQETLAKENQWLPIDVPDPEKMTIAGVVAANVSGPRRLGYGTIRDYLLGIHFVTDDAVEVKGGGRVVKNVAGYDLMKLHIGALGTMGVITQVTLKVRPRPEVKAYLGFSVPREKLNAAIEVIQRTACRPIAASISHIGKEAIDRSVDIFRSGVNYKGEPITKMPTSINEDSLKDMTGSFVGRILLEEKQETLKWQVTTIRKELGVLSIAPMIFQDNEKSDKFMQHHVASQNDKRTEYTFTATIPPSQLAEYMNHFTLASVCAGICNGVVWIYTDSHSELVGDIIQACRAPTAWKTPERVFGKPTPAFELMRHIKRTLDPDNVFNPGRMFS